MDREIVERIIEEQENRGITDRELGKLVGIEEHNIYYLKNYKQYISKIAVIAFTSVLGLEIESIEKEIEKNKKKVGVPETNLEIAHNLVDPEYVEMLHKEIRGLSKNKATLESKTKIIQKLEQEIKEKEEEIESLEEEIRRAKADGYREGVSVGAKQVGVMKEINQEKDIEAMLSEYKTRIGNQERVLKEERLLYKGLYTRAIQEGVKDMVDFRAPIGYTKEQIEEEIRVKEGNQESKEEKEKKEMLRELRDIMGMDRESIQYMMELTDEEYDEIERIIDQEVD